jgi:hypothetical protein
MYDVACINALHRETTARWHAEEVDQPHAGLWGVVCLQHGFNFRLWHEEDKARAPEAGDARIATVKRAIDKLNQQRNDAIEQINDFLEAELRARGVRPAADAPLNTETPGSVVDRLSILALRIFHLEEQLNRTDVNESHRSSVAGKLAICREQQADLSLGLRQLLDDLEAGRKRHKNYRALKMYNDPSLNPYLYDAERRKAA